MKKIIQTAAFTLALIIISLSSAVLGSQDNSPAQYENEFDYLLHAPQVIMPLSEIRPGMMGKGYNIFHGLTMAEFDVEIQGLLINQSAHASDLILGRIYGEPVETVGVIAGMSGSPVYIDGKIIGAVCAAYQWQIYPMVYIRPVETMRSMVDVDYIQREQSVPSLDFIPLEQSLLQQYYEENPEFQNQRQSNNALPVFTPICFNGFIPEVIDTITPGLRDFGYEPVMGGGQLPSILGIEHSGQLYPGDAVGLSYLSGDLSATSVGTVTYREDDTLLIFGHQATSSGMIDFPITREYIQGYIPLQSLSFKIGSTVEEIGRAVYDSAVGVVCRIGEYAGTIPFSIALHNGEQEINLNMQVVKDKVFFPNMVSAAIVNSVKLYMPDNALSTIDYEFEVQVKNLLTGEVDTLFISDLITGMITTDNMTNGVLKLIDPLKTLVLNQFNDIEIQDIKARINLIPDWHAAKISRITIMNNEIHPGDNISVMVKFDVYQDVSFQRLFEIQVPESLRASNIILGVAGADDFMKYQIELAPGRFIFRNYEQLFDYFSTSQDNSELVIWLDLPDYGYMVNGYELDRLPPSMASVIIYGNQTGISSIPARQVQRYGTEYFLYGQQTVSLAIDLD